MKLDAPIGWPDSAPTYRFTRRWFLVRMGMIRHKMAPILQSLWVHLGFYLSIPENQVIPLACLAVQTELCAWRFEKRHAQQEPLYTCNAKRFELIPDGSKMPGVVPGIFDHAPTGFRTNDPPVMSSCPVAFNLPKIRRNGTSCGQNNQRVHNNSKGPVNQPLFFISASANLLMVDTTVIWTFCVHINIR